MFRARVRVWAGGQELAPENVIFEVGAFFVAAAAAQAPPQWQRGRLEEPVAAMREQVTLDAGPEAVTLQEDAAFYGNLRRGVDDELVALGGERWEPAG